MELGFHGWGRADINLEMFDNPITPGNNDYIVTPFVANLPLLTVRMGVLEPSQDTWNRDLGSYLYEHPGWKQVFETDHYFHLTIIDLPRLLCPLMRGRTYCVANSPVIDNRDFSYGWRIYFQEIP